MRNVAIAAAVGAAFGALAALAFSPRSVARAGESPEVVLALNELRDATALLRRAVEAGPALRAARAEPPPPPSGAPPPRPDLPPGDDARPPPPPPRPEADRPASASETSGRVALRELLGFAEETGNKPAAVEARRRVGVRERWLFAGERQVLEAFGTPDEVIVNENSEHWNYRLPTQSEDEDEDIVLVFSRGRLVQVW
jgi:hypothetical protein